MLYSNFHIFNTPSWLSDLSDNKPFSSSNCMGSCIFHSLLPCLYVPSETFKIKVIASVLTMLIIILIILGPFTYLSFILVDEIGNFIENANKGSLDSIRNIFSNPHVSNIVNKVQSYIGIEGINIGDMIMEKIKKIGRDVIGRLSSGIGNLAGMFIDFIFMLFSVFFLSQGWSGFPFKNKELFAF